jgi:hypothetical protein
MGHPQHMPPLVSARIMYELGLIVHHKWCIPRGNYTSTATSPSWLWIFLSNAVQTALSVNILHEVMASTRIKILPPHLAGFEYFCPFLVIAAGHWWQCYCSLCSTVPSTACHCFQGHPKKEAIKKTPKEEWQIIKLFPPSFVSTWASIIC